MTEIVFETHATTTDNEAGIATGWRPGTLSAAGRAQAVELGRRWSGLAAVIASDLGRAVETASLAFPGRFTVDARLRECSYGELDGAPAAVVDGARVSHVYVPWPGGESYRDVVDRTRSLLADLSAVDGARVLLIGHSANRMALEHLCNGRPLADAVAAPTTWRPGWCYPLPS